MAAQTLEGSLFQAITEDDLKAFDALMEKAQCGAYRLGRFPVLSLLYLYKSRRILSKYEQSFLKITSYEPLHEPPEISKKFSAKAGKCLRLYFSEVVSPIEMLLVLDKTKHLKRVYPLTKPTAAVKDRLKSIYSIKYSLKVQFEGDEIIIERRPLSYREKKNIATVCLCSVLAVTLGVGVPVTAVTLAKPVDGEVTRLSHIDFDSQNEYTLKRDIVVPANYSVKKVNCKINGGGKRLIFGKGAQLGEFNGKLSDVTIESFGDAIFTSVSESATIEDITVNVTADVKYSSDTALVAVTNYGTIKGVTVNVSGKMNALTPTAEGVTELTFGGIVQSNSYRYAPETNTLYRGLIKNCTVNYSKFTLCGEASANASYGGVAGINNGFVQDCTVTGKIIADTFDIGGICAVNNYLLSGATNTADVTQTSSDTGWNPISCGIVIRNTNAVEKCENRGIISAVSNCGQFELQEEYEATASAAGIAYLSRGSTTNPYIKDCTNSGSVNVYADYRNTYAAGICLSSHGRVESSKNTATVTVESDNGMGTYVGGITTLTYGSISKSVNEGSISAKGNGLSYIGGISAHSSSLFYNCYSSGEITVTAQTICAGGILGLSEVTSDGFYIYCGNVDHCLSDSKINVTVVDDKPAYMGGIAGYVREARVINGDSVFYCGGSITNCFYTGKCETKISYFGNIVGVCGANSYGSDLYISGGIIYNKIEGNIYLNSEFNALGMTVTSDGEFVSVEDKGANSATSEEIENSETYKSILNALKIA